VFGSDAVETGIPADVWRYYLLANRPEQQVGGCGGEKGGQQERQGGTRRA
jgi:methionyl-tRNA synthetase